MSTEQLQFAHCERGVVGWLLPLRFESGWDWLVPYFVYSFHWALIGPHHKFRTSHVTAKGRPVLTELQLSMDQVRQVGSYLRHVVGRISSGTFRVDTAHLAFVVVEELDGRCLQIVEAGRFREGGHVVMDVLL